MKDGDLLRFPEMGKKTHFVIYGIDWDFFSKVINNNQPGWWLGHPSEKYEFVNWDDDSNPI